MPKYIDAEPLIEQYKASIEWLEKNMGNIDCVTFAGMMSSSETATQILEEAPPAHVKPIVKGAYTGEAMVASYTVRRCSVCGEYAPVGIYCYMCGADLRYEV